MVDLQVDLNFPGNRTKLPLVLKQNIHHYRCLSFRFDLYVITKTSFDLIIMAVSTGQLDISKQEMVLFITGVCAKDQPGWKVSKGVQDASTNMVLAKSQMICQLG